MADDKIDIGRAWKDEEYRNSLTPEQLAIVPPNPAGELSEEDLQDISGGLAACSVIYPPPPHTSQCISSDCDHYTDWCRAKA